MKFIVPGKRLEKIKEFLSKRKKAAGSEMETLVPPLLERFAQAEGELPKNKEDRPWYIGTTDQLLVLNLSKQEKESVIFAEAGKEIYKLGAVVTIAKKLTIGKKILDLLYEPYITNYSGTGAVGFAGNVPGEILAIKLEPNDTIFTPSDSFVAAIGNKNFDISFEFKKKSVSSFITRGDLLFMKATNNGDKDAMLFLYSYGGYKVFELTEGQKLSVDVGLILGWDNKVIYKVGSSGIKSVLFKGEGFFLNHLTGPGVVIVQGTTLSKLKLTIGETICLAPPPIIVWQLVQKKVKQVIYGSLFG